MKKLLLIPFFLVPLIVFNQEPHYNKWYWADGKEFSNDPVINGPVGPAVQIIRKLTGKKYLCLETSVSVWQKEGAILLFLYKPLIHQTELISTSDTAVIKQDIEGMEARNYLLSRAYVDDFHYLRDSLHANREYIESVLGKPDFITRSKLPDVIVYEYAKAKFDLTFHKGQLASYSLYTRDKQLNSLVKRYGSTIGVNIFFRQVSEGMTKDMVIQALGKPYKTTKALNTKRGKYHTLIYRVRAGTTPHFNYYNFLNNKVMSMQEYHN